MRGNCLGVLRQTFVTRLLTWKESMQWHWFGKKKKKRNFQRVAPHLIASLEWQEGAPPTGKPTHTFVPRARLSLRIRGPTHRHTILRWQKTSRCHGNPRGTRSGTSRASWHKWIYYRTPQSRPHTRRYLKKGKDMTKRDHDTNKNVFVTLRTRWASRPLSRS